MKISDDQPAEENIEENGTVVSPVADTTTKQLQEEVENWKNKYLRALADYQNLEKRSFQEKDDARKFAAEVTLRKFIPAIDSLERAVKHIEDKGLSLSLKEFYAALSSCGVQRIDTVGKVFDPYTMECLEVVEGDDGVVVEEILSGYVLFEKVLRVAQVKVGRKKV